jgi:hypothetical protein
MNQLVTRDLEFSMNSVIFTQQHNPHIYIPRFST